MAWYAGFTCVDIKPDLHSLGILYSNIGWVLW